MIRVAAIEDVSVDRPADARVRSTWVALYRVVEPLDGAVVFAMNSLRPQATDVRPCGMRT